MYSSLSPLPPPPHTPHPLTQMYGMIHLCNLQTMLTKLEVAVLLTSAACHDLDHPGFNNKLAAHSLPPPPLLLLLLPFLTHRLTYFPFLYTHHTHHTTLCSASVVLVNYNYNYN